CRRSSSKRPVADLESYVTRLKYPQQLTINFASRNLRNHACKFEALLAGEIDLDPRSRNIPGDVLTADEIVRGAVIQRISLDQGSGRRNDPLPGMQSVVGVDRVHEGTEWLGISEILFEEDGRVLTQRLARIEDGHEEELLRRCTPVRCWQTTRAETEVVADRSNQLPSIDGNGIQRSPVYPLLHQKAMTQPHGLGRVTGLREQFAFFKLAHAFAAKARKLDEPGFVSRPRQELVLLRLLVARRPNRLIRVAEFAPLAAREKLKRMV